MGSNRSRRRVARTTKIESLEDRQLFSAEPMGGLLGSLEQHALVEPPVEQHAAPTADFWYDANLDCELDALLGDVEQSLASAHQLTGVARARADYGFTGLGQTVAVIDSGIAWDHASLGGGFGAGYRVVGGWDFTEENDENPYDDGPAGAHGTHVAGIVGASQNSSGDAGVAPGVDLVGLRVFNDQGAGYFSWVEKALDWVHDNRNSFANPITAVNLSLGTAWNAATVPNWAMLEDEFAQLEADGIFIAVSAGNSFSKYNATGLSYPAASSHVIPVMSVDDSGALSYFSQRHSRAIAAPGRSVRSTVPDYVGNQNRVTDDWANFSGTSMASPYVAGASVLIREAMQFVGYANITQDTIYDHMLATADQFFDSATNQLYRRLNVSAALDALMPEDDFGSKVDSAYDLGTIGADGMELSGLIGKVDDVDYFTFTAAVGGKLTLSATGSHHLAPQVNVIGSTATENDGVWSLDLVAGKSYAISLATAAGQGVGYYHVGLTLEPVAPLVLTVKSQVRGDGAVFSLDTDGWLSVNGQHTWENTRDFALGADGTLYWHGADGRLARRQPDGSWQTLDRNAEKFAVHANGTAYSVGTDHWGSVNGQRVWQNTADFALADDGSIYWQDTSGNLYRRSSSGTWRRLNQDVVKFAVRSDGVAYALRADNCVCFDTVAVWQNTRDFVLTEDQAVYWHSTNGSLYRLPSGGSWQLVSREATQFAVGEDGTVYTLVGDRVAVDGSPAWSGICSMRTDGWGRLVLERSDGTTRCIEGRFDVSTNHVVSLSTSGSSDGATVSGQARSVDVAFNALGRGLSTTLRLQSPFADAGNVGVSASSNADNSEECPSQSAAGVVDAILAVASQSAPEDATPIIGPLPRTIAAIDDIADEHLRRSLDHRQFEDAFAQVGHVAQADILAADRW